MKVELIQRAANALFDVPDDVHAELAALLTAVAHAPRPRSAQGVSAAFGEWCWLVYTIHGDVVEVLDVGCAR